jgi:hypothetical protein
MINLMIVEMLYLEIERNNSFKPKQYENNIFLLLGVFTTFFSYHGTESCETPIKSI